MTVGVLVFYRWPPGTQWTGAPLQCQPFVTRTANRISYIGIWQGHQGNRNSDPWSPEKRTAIALVAVTDADAAEVAGLDEAFSQGPLLCRYHAATPSSAVAWVPGQHQVTMETTNEDGIPEVLDLMRHNQVRILEGLTACVRSYKERVGGLNRSARSRVQSDLEACERPPMLYNCQCRNRKCPEQWFLWGWTCHGDER